MPSTRNSPGNYHNAGNYYCMQLLQEESDTSQVLRG